MKLALNGALTIGTLDGANVEILRGSRRREHLHLRPAGKRGRELRAPGYNPWDYYNKSPVLKKVMDLIASGFFSPEEPHLFRPIFDSLLIGGDRFFVMADFDAYVECQKNLAQIYKNDIARWTRMSIQNVANIGIFSSDRAINEYAKEIWHAKPVEVQLDNNHWDYSRPDGE